MENKVCLVIGASGGIGKQIAIDFANNGYKVAMQYNKSKHQIDEVLDSFKEKSGIFAVKADITNPKSITRMVQSVINIFGHIDVLVNCAGICDYNLLIDETYDNIINVVGTNLSGVIFTCKEVSKRMISVGCGKIINISSIWGECGASGETVYSATKGGINTFTKALAKELAYSNINVNAIAPGVVDTNMMKKFSDKELNDLKNEIPFGRFATTSDISNMALFLASDKASYITGQIITISGGFSL